MMYVTGYTLLQCVKYHSGPVAAVSKHEPLKKASCSEARPEQNELSQLLFNYLCGDRNFSALAHPHPWKGDHLLYSVFPWGSACVTLTENISIHFKGSYRTNSHDVRVVNLKAFWNFEVLHNQSQLKS